MYEARVLFDKYVGITRYRMSSPGAEEGSGDCQLETLVRKGRCLCQLSLAKSAHSGDEHIRFSWEVSDRTYTLGPIWVPV